MKLVYSVDEYQTITQVQTQKVGNEIALSFEGRGAFVVKMSQQELNSFIACLQRAEKIIDQTPLVVYARHHPSCDSRAGSDCDCLFCDKD